MSKEPKLMTKKQRKEFLRIWIGCNLFHLDFGFDETDIDGEDVLLLEDEKIKESCKYLKDNDAFTTTSDVYEYVIKNY